MVSKCHSLIGGILLATTIVVSGCQDRSGESTVVVFAAASLSDVVADIAERFEELNPDAQVILNLSGSSVLARQIIAGADYDVFLSANEGWVEEVEAARGSAATRKIAISNKLVAIWRDSNPPGGDKHGSLFEGSGRIAVADPGHVPAGIYARSALECEGIWESISARLIPTLDVRAAVAAVQSGNADLGIVYASDAANADLEVQALDPECQPEIIYAATLERNEKTVADEFYAFVDESAQHDLWTRHGFQLRHD